MRNFNDLKEIKTIIRSLCVSSRMKLTVSRLEKDFKNVVYTDCPYKAFGHNSFESFLKSMPDVVQVRGNGAEAEVCVIVTENTSHLVQPKPGFGTLPKRCVTVIMPDDLLPQDRIPILKDLESACTLGEPDSSSYSNHCIPKEIKERLTFIMSKYESLWCAQIPAIYTNLYGKKLDYLLYGYKSLIQMCMDLPDIFSCHRPGVGDWIIEYSEKVIHDDPSPDIHEDTLNILRLGTMVPKQRLPFKILVSDVVDVFVGVERDPAKFSILLYEQLHLLNSFMDSLQVFYENNEKRYKVPSAMLEDGLCCVTKSENKFYRAVLINRIITEGLQMWRPSDNKIPFYAMDYGRYEYAMSSEIYYLDTRFSYYPQQAIQAKLEDIKLTPKFFTAWMREPQNRFRSLINQHVTFKAEILSMNDARTIVGINLIGITETDEELSINDQLVEDSDAISLLPPYDSTQPPDLHLKDLPDQEIPDDLSTIEVFVITIVSPSRIRVALETEYRKYKLMLKRMQSFYNQVCEDDRYIVPEEKIALKVCYVTKTENTFIRVSVVNLDYKRSEHLLKVYSVDIGDVFLIDRRSLYYLTSEFSNLSRLAIRCSMADIYPTSLEEDWTESAKTRIQELTLHKCFLAQRIHILQERDGHLTLNLLDTTTLKSMNDILVQEGHAQSREDVEKHCEEVQKHRLAVELEQLRAANGCQKKRAPPPRPKITLSPGQMYPG